MIHVFCVWLSPFLNRMQSGFFAALHFRIHTVAKYVLLSKTDVQTPSGMARIQPWMRPTYISYLLEQTDSGGEIANWTRCPNKCLHVVRGQDLEPQNQSTLLIRLNTEPLFTCFKNAYWTIHLFFTYGVHYGVLCKKYVSEKCCPFLLHIAYIV